MSGSHHHKHHAGEKIHKGQDSTALRSRSAFEREEQHTACNERAAHRERQPVAFTDNECDETFVHPRSMRHEAPAQVFRAVRTSSIIFLASPNSMRVLSL